MGAFRQTTEWSSGPYHLAVAPSLKLLKAIWTWGSDFKPVAGKVYSIEEMERLKDIMLDIKAGYNDGPFTFLSRLVPNMPSSSASGLFMVNFLLVF